MNLMHLGFLAAGAAAMTLPLWIHLLLRQRARSVDIGSIRFVQQVVRRTRSRQRLQRWLLLAIRALAVLLLGFLFARPFFPATPADGRTRKIAILIDRSASMSVTGEGGKSAIDIAAERAKQHIATLGDQTQVEIALFDSSGVHPIKLDDLNDVATVSLGTRYDDAFAWATDQLARSARADRELFLLSDLQRIGGGQTDLTGFPADIPVRIEDIAPPVAQNLAVESALATQVELRPGIPIAINLQIVNHGAIPIKNVPIQIRLDGPGGSLIEDQSISLAANERRSIDVPLEIDKPGVFYGNVVINRDDALDWDNERFLAFEVRYPDRVLLIDGDAGEKSWENETYFIETALRLKTAVGEGPARTFEVERLVWDRGAGFPDLAGFRLIVAANLARFSDRDVERLRDFVQSGGNVLWFPGERSTESVHAKLVESGLLGECALERATDAVARVNQFDRSHPALDVFGDPQRGDLRSLVTSRLIPVVQVDPASEILVRSRRFPLVISHQTGEGQFVFVATSADRSWSQWPQNRLFVPLVRQVAAWLTGQLDARRPVRGEIIDRPDQEPGIHQIDGSIVAHNVESGESGIGRYGVESFREATGLPEQSLVTTETDRREQFRPEGASRSDEKWPQVVWALLGLLSFELILASRVHE